MFFYAGYVGYRAIYAIWRKSVPKRRPRTQRVKMSKKRKKAKIDGFGPREKQMVRNAVRQVWQRSLARRLAVKRATGADGFPRCEGCGKKVPKVTIDHMVAVGEMDGGFLERMFCPSSGLKALCYPCHGKKTRADNKALEDRRAEALGFL